MQTILVCLAHCDRLSGLNSWRHVISCCLSGTKYGLRDNPIKAVACLLDLPTGLFSEIMDAHFWVDSLPRKLWLFETRFMKCRNSRVTRSALCGSRSIICCHGFSPALYLVQFKITQEMVRCIWHHWAVYSSTQNHAAGAACPAHLESKQPKDTN